MFNEHFNFQTHIHPFWAQIKLEKVESKSVDRGNHKIKRDELNENRKKQKCKNNVTCVWIFFIHIYYSKIISLYWI